LRLLLIFGVLIYDMIHITVERVATGKVRSIKEWSTAWAKIISITGWNVR